MTFRKIKIKLAAPEKYSHRHITPTYKSKPFRSEFERDRDRILYSKEFRRLSGKTQVFLTQAHDHVRTRLTHTLEVAQISRIIANNLNLDPVLCEAIALGHDVGHTPFGHVGERTLSLIMNNCDHLASFQNEMDDKEKGFKHNLQSLRVTCDLEQTYGESGLNLSNFTLWGIKNHSKETWPPCKHKDEHTCKCHLKRTPSKCTEKGIIKVNFYDHYNEWLVSKKTLNPAWSFEGQVVAIADEIAQRHHDIEDSIFVKLIPHQELVERIRDFFSNFFDDEDRLIFEDLNKSIGNNRKFSQFVSKFIVNFMTKKVILNSIPMMEQFIRDYNIKSRKDFIKTYKEIDDKHVGSVICYCNDLHKTDKQMQSFLRDRILNSLEVQRMDGKGNYIIRRIFKAYLSNPRQLHDSTIYFTFRQYEEDMQPLHKLTKQDIGKLRNRIDSPAVKSDVKFQISLLRGICDHVAGMTDNFALKEYKRLYG